MLRRVIATLAILGASSADAQIIRMPTSTSPAIVGSLSLGFLRAQNVADGETGSVWDFGSAIQYRATLEREFREQSTYGISVSYADMPMQYVRTTPPTGGPGTLECPAQCDASADLWTIMATFSAGGGAGFHQVLQIGAGVNVYRNFVQDGTGTPLPPESSDTDLALNIGYGFGFGFSERVAIQLVQDAGLSVHQRRGLSGNQSAMSQQLVTRIGVRYGLGSR